MVFVAPVTNILLVGVAPALVNPTADWLLSSDKFVKNNLLKLVDNHYDEMITNNLFPDNGHPSDSAHEQLIDWFVKIDQGTL